MKRREFLKNGIATGAAIASVATGSYGSNTASSDNTLPHSNTVTLPQQTIPVRGEYDVVVAGGGLGGVSAAVAAARAGAKTILIERNGFLGGVATAGMCSSVYNCLYTPSHELVVRGNSAMFVDRLAQATGYGRRWRDHIGHVIFDVEKGEVTFTKEMKEKAARFSDSVGKGVVEHNIRKHKGERAWGAQVLSNETYDIPYRCLIPQQVDGLIMGAGRSVSQENPYLLRVMAMTMVVGQAAGAAAALAAKTQVTPRNLDITRLQEQLKNQDVNV